ASNQHKRKAGGANIVEDATVQQRSLRQQVRANPFKQRLKPFRKNWDLYVLILPVIVYFVIFEYFPMYGVQIAFKDFMATKGITGSPWAGMKHFDRFFDSYYFWRLIRNTLGIGLYELAVGFPIPILLALMINEARSKLFSRFTQTVTYAPHFLSTVVV